MKIDTDRIRAAASVGELAACLRDVADLRRMPGPTFSAVSRRLRELDLPADLRVAYLGNTTLDLLPTYVETLAAAGKLVVRSYVGAYDQYLQELLRTDSDLWDFEPHVVVLLVSLRDLRPREYSRLFSLGAEGRQALRSEVLEHVSTCIHAAERIGSCVTVVANFPSPPSLHLGVADSKEPYGEAEFYDDLNDHLRAMLRERNRAQLFDLDRVTAAFGKEGAEDARMYHLARVDWSIDFFPWLADQLVRHLLAVAGRTRKCLVVDLDNTLWGGVVGEEGPLGVRLGPDDPEGAAFARFQWSLKALQERGVILAICSKNNPEDVWEAFEKNPHMVLREEDFAVTGINWRPKHENLAEIAAALNIGTDSLVFVDDSPAEVALINKMMPEVRTVQLPDDPARFVEVLNRLNDFEKPYILQEDRQKTIQYRQITARKESRAQAADLESFLFELGTRVEIRTAMPADLPRLAQLVTKTNQFNVTTIRYSLAELEEMLHQLDVDIGIVSAEDRFGTLGKIGAYILRQAEQPTIDTFLLSCRALGRGIETAVMNHIKCRFLASEAPNLHARLTPTGRNQPAVTFYDEEGFSRVSVDGDGTVHYRLDREAAQPRPCAWIQVVAPDASNDEQP